MGENTKVLIVDDSAVVRMSLTNQLSKHQGIEVVGSAPDPYVAREMILKHKPDVITLDLEMPRMDGLTFLRKLMAAKPIPTIVISSLTPKGCETALACIEAGAVHVLAKPSAAYSVGDLTDELARLIHGAKHIKLDRRKPVSASKPITTAMIETTNKIVAVGSSTGGTDALTRLLTPLPPTAPGIVIVQHMPAGFTKSFADRLDTLCQLEVTEAQDGDSVVPGRALLAPGERHMKLLRDGARYIVRVYDGERVCRHRPSVHVLFESVAKHAGANAMGVMLTGMGDDGAEAMKSMHDAGAFNVAQNKESCVVFGMPHAAIEAGGVDEVLHLDSIPQRIADFASAKFKRAA
ncbi:MAG: chemotaxis response regulator protein-glutamate methylesterase [Phycisphaerales bacterium]